jgi:hypothetical protein
MALAVVDREMEVWERNEARVAELSGLLNATYAALVDTIAEVIESESWGGAGYRSPEHWVALHCGLSRARATQLVAAARRVAELPACAARFRTGELSVDQAVRVLARTPSSHDEMVADLAPQFSVGQLRQVLSALPPLPRPEPEPVTRERRRFEGHHRDDGTFVVRGEMPGDCAALFEKAMGAARSDLIERGVDDVDQVDAFERVLKLALDGLDPATARGDSPGERYQVMLHIDRRQGETGDLVQPHLGPWLPPCLSRYLTCDAPVRLALYDTDPDGTSRLVGFSPRARTVDAKLRAAIEHRDRGCRVPGCDSRAWLHIHHIRHWEDGGPTVPSNLVALCPRHHRLHHQGHLRIEGDPELPGGLRVTDRWGHPTGTSPPKPPSASKPLHAAARDLDVPAGTSWQHPWGLPLDRRALVWA